MTNTLINSVKELIQQLLGKAGYEIHRKQRKTPCQDPLMAPIFAWLKKHGFTVNTVLDVGASDGRWSRSCMAYFPAANYVLYEPQPVHSKMLDSFASEFPDRVITVEKAVGPVEGKLLFDVTQLFGGGPAKPESEKVLQVEQTTIDASVSEIAVTGPYLLKLDTHGYEKSILSGSEQTLKQCEILIIEAYNYHITEEAMLFWELCACLAEKGFRTVDLVELRHRPHDQSFWQMDIVFVRDDWQGFNYLSYN